MKKEEKKEKEEEDEKIENLHVRKVSRRLWERFTGLAATRRGKLHGILGEELEEAITFYLEIIEKEEAESPSLKGAHTHTEKEKFKHKGRGREIKDHEVAYQKENGKPIAYPLNSRERRLRQIGKILLGGSGVISLKGLERIIVTQKVGDRRVINDYKKVLEVKGWIKRISPVRYAIVQEEISDDLNLPLVNGHAKKVEANVNVPKIKHTHENPHKIPEITNGGVVKY